MNDPLHEQVLALHRQYNQIAELQQQLPARQPRHARYAARERQVQEKAQEVLMAARQVPSTGTDYHAEVENIVAGCAIMRLDPYKKLGGIVPV